MRKPEPITTKNDDSLENHGAAIGELAMLLDQLRARVYALQTILVVDGQLASHAEVQKRTDHFLKQFSRGYKRRLKQLQKNARADTERRIRKALEEFEGTKQ
jgi:hypothetical protein